MTTTQAIHIEGLSKCYRIGHQREKTLGGTLLQRLSLPGRRRDEEIFWALDDVHLEVQQGEVLGIIGRNGAGKTTLLKLLSRITYPTRGSFTIRGRVASLLEVGTGFHPELSGRENIFLNGTILGMTRSEVRERFDEIVDFSGVEQFLDTPVKRYSSGMFVRLAFSIAAHLDPEVLIIDEVLAVGDAAFQRKCLGKMGEVARRGRTVLFVSHNMGAVKQLCTRAVMIEKGRIAFRGNTGDTIAAYYSGQEAEMTGYRQRYGNRRAEFISWSMTGDDGLPRTEFRMGEAIMLLFNVRFNDKVVELDFGISIRDHAGEPLTHILNHDERYGISGEKGQERQFSVRMPQVMLSPGKYAISVGMEKFAEDMDVMEDAFSFSMIQGEGIGRTTPYPSNVRFYLPCEWRTTP